MFRRLLRDEKLRLKALITPINMYIINTTATKGLTLNVSMGRIDLFTPQYRCFLCKDGWIYVDPKGHGNLPQIKQKVKTPVPATSGFVLR